MVVKTSFLMRPSFLRTQEYKRWSSVNYAHLLRENTCPINLQVARVCTLYCCGRPAAANRSQIRQIHTVHFDANVSKKHTSITCRVLLLYYAAFLQTKLTDFAKINVVLVDKTLMEAGNTILNYRILLMP